MDKEQVKRILTSVITKEVVQDYKGYEEKLKQVLLKGLKTNTMSPLDWVSLKLLVDTHLMSQKEEPSTEEVFKSDSIDGVMDKLAMLGRNERCKIDVFLMAFDKVKLERLSKQLSIVANDRKKSLIGYLEDPVSWADKEKKGFLAVGAKQVYYQEVLDEPLESDYKSKYDILSTNAYAKLQSMFGQDYVIEPVRFIGPNEIAIDFEEYGYHVKTAGPAKELSDLLEIENSYSQLLSEYNETKRQAHNRREVAYMLSTLVDELNHYYGPEFVLPVMGAGEGLTHLVLERINNAGNQNQQQELLKAIGEQVKEGPHAKLLAKEVMQSLDKVTKSMESVTDFVLAHRQSLFNRVSAKELDKISQEFDKNVNDAIELKKSGDVLGFKRAYQALNVFERLSVDLSINEKKEASLDEDCSPS